jgi:HK97 family phage major capsid protein
MSLSRELREKRAKLVADAQALIPAAGAMTAEIRTKFDAMIADADTLKADIERVERADALSAEVRAVRPPEQHIANPRDEKTLRSEWNKALKDYAIKGEGAMSAENRAILSGTVPEFRDMGVGVTTAGGFLVPQGFVYEVETALKYYGPMLSVGRILPTASGNPLPYPTVNDTTVVGELVAENTTVTNADLTVGQLTLNAFKFSTKMIPVSIELIQDSAFNLDSYLKDTMATRLGRILNTKFTVGAGTTEPKGIITAAIAGPTAVGSASNDGSVATGANSIGSDDLVALEHSVDPLYRPGAKFMLHDSTLKSIKQLKDKQGRPLWLPGLGVNAPDTILGYPYAINNDMATIATTAKTVLFGAIDKYLIRQVKELAILRLNERFADKGQVAFIGFARYDATCSTPEPAR